MRILAIDPGPVQSAYVLLDGMTVLAHRIEPNEAIHLGRISPHLRPACVIEMIASYGMAVGRETFETCVWIGRFIEQWRHATAPHYIEPTRLPRLAVEVALCHDSRAKDANIRAALIDRFGGPFCIRKGGALYKVHGDEWAALGVAVAYQIGQDPR
jgi:hypothetical protein